MNADSTPIKPSPEIKQDTKLFSNERGRGRGRGRERERGRTLWSGSSSFDYNGVPAVTSRSFCAASYWPDSRHPHAPFSALSVSRRFPLAPLTNPNPLLTRSRDIPGIITCLVESWNIFQIWVAVYSRSPLHRSPLVQEKGFCFSLY